MPITERTEQILEDIRAGKKYRVIARKYGIGITRVGNIAAMAKLPLRNRRIVRTSRVWRST